LAEGYQFAAFIFSGKKTCHENESSAFLWCLSTKLHGVISEKAATIAAVAVCFEEHVF
jgi:hypothetical protein